MTGYVYFIKPAGMEGPIKIGHSRLPQRRLEQITLWSPLPLEIMHSFEARIQMEYRIHKRFSGSHSHSEWFHPSEDLLEFIRLLKSGVDVEVATDWTLEGKSIRRRHSMGWSEESKQRLSVAQKAAWQSRRERARKELAALGATQ